MPEYVTPTILASSDGVPAMGYLNLSNLKMDQLVNFNVDIGGLFARFCIDKIVSTFIPMYSTVTSDGNIPSANYHFSPNLRVTRVNTKWLNEPFGFQANAKDQTEELAQLQSKSCSMYASKRPLTVVTHKPGTYGIILKDPTDITTTKPIRKKNQWMDVADHADAEFPHNSVVFMERIDGGDLTVDWQYRVTHKVYFRTSQVG